MMNKGDHLAMSKKFLKYASESFIKLHFFFIISAPCLSMNSKLVNCNLSLYSVEYFFDQKLFPGGA